MALIKLMISIYILSLIISLFIGFLRFLVDISRWHDKEKKVIISNSNDNEGGVYDERDNSSDNGRGECDNLDGDYSGAADPESGNEPLVF